MLCESGASGAEHHIGGLFDGLRAKARFGGLGPATNDDTYGPFRIARGVHTRCSRVDEHVDEVNTGDAISSVDNRNQPTCDAHQ